MQIRPFDRAPSHRRRARSFACFARLLAPCALLFGLIALAPARARAAALTIEEAVRLTLANNELAQKAPLRVDAADGALDRARAAFLPNLSLSGSGALRSVEDRNGRIFSTNVNLTLTMPLIMPSAWPLYSQAKHNLEAERWGAVQDRRLVAFDAARAFLIVLTSERVMEAANAKLERARANQKNAEARVEAQLSSTNDVTRAQVDTAAASRDVAQAQGGVARAYLQLAYLLGKTVAPPLAPPSKLTRAAESGVFRAEELVKAAEDKRPDVRAAKEKTAAARDAARETLFRIAPTLSASGQIHFTPDAVAPDKPHDEQVQLSLAWTLYDAGTRYGDRRTKVAQANSQALDEKRLRRSIAIDVGLTLTALKTARDLYKISEDAVAAAKKNTVETEALYQQGLAKAIEVSDANSKRFDAEVSRATARLQMEQAYLELRFARGLDPIDDAPDGAQKPADGPVERPLQ